MIDRAVAIFAHLNVVTGKAFRCRNPNGSVTAMGKSVINRLKEGYTVEDFCRVIDHKWKQWGADERWRGYVNPMTLSRPSHFAQYLGECGPVEKPVQRAITQKVEEPRADPQKVRAAIDQGWKILNGGKAA